MTEKNLYQKLVEVRKSVKYIQKTADGYKFKYASEGQILAAIRETMDEQNVFLEMEMISLEPVTCYAIVDKTMKELQGLKCVFEFIWTNADKPEEQIKKRMILQDSESIIKTCGGLMTYANKYFLYKFFSVPTDKLDPDAFENIVEKIISSEETKEESKSAALSEDQKNQLKKLCDEFPKTVPYLVERFKVSDIFSIRPSDFVHVVNVFERARQKRAEAGAMNGN